MTFKKQTSKTSDKSIQNYPVIGFVSLGCPKALVDCEKIISRLHSLGYRTTNNYEDSDLVVINTCGFIESAVNESLEAISEAMSANGSVVVSGCLGKYPEKIINRFPQVRKIVGADVEEVVRAVSEILPIDKILTSLNSQSQKSALPEHGIKLTPNHYAYLKIAEGCNHKCKFCIIPKMRGKLISRPVSDVMREAKSLADNGCQELLIIAQDLLAYGNDWRKSPKEIKSNKHNLITLIDELAKLKIWLRLHYIYPYPWVEEIIERMASGAVLPYLDIPLQHVNSRVLRSMQRPAGPSSRSLQENFSEKLITRIQNWRKICPELVIRSTFIVGYPGERESEFEELLSFIGEANLDRVGCFTYSDVEGAAANKLAEQIPEKVKLSRQKRLMKLQEKVSKNKLKNRLGITERVIVQEEVLADGELFYLARGYGEAPEIDGVILISKNWVEELTTQRITAGEHLSVKIIKSTAHDLIAEPIEVLPKFNSSNKKLKIKTIPIVGV